MNTKHKPDCKMAFGRKDPTCPRCQELLNGAPANCIRPGCPNKAHSRGLCSADYNAAQRLIKQGKTTMKALEKAGKILPLKSKPRDNSWLLGEMDNG